MAVTLKLYVDEPFDLSTEGTLVDLFEDLDGVEDTFTLSNKTNIDLAATLQADADQFYFYNGGFSKSGTYDFTTDEPPALGSNLVAPGRVALVVDAYDVASVDGVPSANIKEVAFYIGNVDDIATTTFVKSDTKDGITLQFKDLIGYGVTEAMFEIACATPDADGTAMTYYTGEIILDTDFSSSSVVCTTVPPNEPTILTLASSDDVDSLPLGDYVILDKGGVHEETCKIIGKSSDTITVTKTDYTHDPGETVFNCARKFWCRFTVPIDFSSQIPKNWFNVILRCIGDAKSRG